MKKELDKNLEKDSNSDTLKGTSEDLESKEESSDSEDVDDTEEVEDVKKKKKDKKSKAKLKLVSEKTKTKINLENLDSDQFTPSLRVVSDKGSPSLESIESRIDRPGFVQMGTGSGVSGSSLSPGGGGGDDTYIPGKAEDGGPKYISSGGEVKTNVRNVDMQSLGRNVGNMPVVNQEDFFVSSQPKFQSGNVEQVGMQPERVDLQNLGRKNPLEIEERKYEGNTKYEFERPK
jgi:hypothetical protein